MTTMVRMGGYWRFQSCQAERCLGQLTYETNWPLCIAIAQDLATNSSNSYHAEKDSLSAPWLTATPYNWPSLAARLFVFTHLICDLKGSLSGCLWNICLFLFPWLPLWTLDLGLLELTHLSPVCLWQGFSLVSQGFSCCVCDMEKSHAAKIASTGTLSRAELKEVSLYWKYIWSERKLFESLPHSPAGFHNA